MSGSSLNWKTSEGCALEALRAARGAQQVLAELEIVGAKLELIPAEVLEARHAAAEAQAAAASAERCAVEVLSHREARKQMQQALHYAQNCVLAQRRLQKALPNYARLAAGGSAAVVVEATPAPPPPMSSSRRPETQKKRARRGTSDRPSRSKQAMGLRLEYERALHPGLSEIRLRKWYEIRSAHKIPEERYKKFQCLQGGDLLEKAAAGQWYLPAMLPGVQELKSKQAQEFIGWVDLATRILGKPGLNISVEQIMQLQKCGYGTVNRFLNLLITGDEHGKRSEVLEEEYKKPTPAPDSDESAPELHLRGFQGWIKYHPDFSPTKRATDPETGKPLKHWQQPNWFEPGPLMIRAQELAKKRLARKMPAAAVPVEEREVSNEKIGVPSPLGDLIQEGHKSSASSQQPQQAPAASPALCEGEKVSPAATVEKLSAPPGEIGVVSDDHAGFAGKTADQEKTLSSSRASGAKFVPSKPIPDELLHLIAAAVERGADEESLMWQAQNMPDMAWRCARNVVGETPPDLPQRAPIVPSYRDPVRHTRRETRTRSSAPPRNGPPPRKRPPPGGAGSRRSPWGRR